MKIPFNRPYKSGKELYYIAQAHFSGHISGDGPYTKECENLLQEFLNSKKVRLTTSGTAAIELALLALDLKHGDEVIVPSFTFVSCANAVLLAGGVPVFAEIDGNTQNISPSSVEKLITKNTRAILIVHYAGVACDMSAFRNIAQQYKVTLIEDAAHCIGSLYNNQELGTHGDFGCFSFHETKNITCGEGGAISINNPNYIDKIDIIREKGTDRTKFLQGLVDKYTWHHKGSSYLPSELTAAFLLAQLENVERISRRRREQWFAYHERLSRLKDNYPLQLPSITTNAVPNGHIYYMLLPDSLFRAKIMESLKRIGIGVVFHYIPLHTSPYGAKFRADSAGMDVTASTASKILRLPLFFELKVDEIDSVVNSLRYIMDKLVKSL